MVRGSERVKVWRENESEDSEMVMEMGMGISELHSWAMCMYGRYLFKALFGKQDNSVCAVVPGRN